MSDEHFDAVVVGSGFGGSVMAYRLAESGLRVCLLERGKRYPPGSFPRTPHGMKSNFWDPSGGLYGMFNVWSFKRMGSLISSGLGGGSLIYANVMLRKDENWFVRQDGAPANEYWPIQRADLETHYDRAEKMLNAQLYPFDHEPYSRTPKTHAMKFAAQQLGLQWMLPPLAVTFANDGETPVPGEPIREEHRNLHDRTRYTCRLCGECDVGCNYGSKNTLDYNYLSEANRLGAQIRDLCEVLNFGPRDGGGFRIRYVHHDPSVPKRRDAPTTNITADRLILSAGTLGSSYLLLKNRASFPRLSQALGTRFCGNGDLLTFAVRSREKTNGKLGARFVEGSYGPVITSAIRMADELDGETGRGFYIEDAGYPAFLSWLVEIAESPHAITRFAKFAWSRTKSMLGLGTRTDIGGDISALLGPCELSGSSLPLLGMGRDVPDGKLILRDDRLYSEWKINLSRSYFDRLQGTMKAMANVWNARYSDNPLWYLDHRVITVHPLGGAPMGRDSKEGVVDSWGRVFDYPGLHIADGSVMPGPVGANPALTIAALSDRFADQLLADAGRS